MSGFLRKAPVWEHGASTSTSRSQGLLYEKAAWILEALAQSIFPRSLGSCLSSVIVMEDHPKISELNFILSKWRMRWWQKGIVVHICLATNGPQDGCSGL